MDARSLGSAIGAGALSWRTSALVCCLVALTGGCGNNTTDPAADIALSDIILIDGGAAGGRQPDGASGGVWTSCPPKGRKDGDPCDATSMQSCDYTKACCCRVCHHTGGCYCGSDGVLRCSARTLDLCMAPNCSMGCASGEWMTKTGCQSCSAIKIAMAKMVSATTAPMKACDETSDCVLLQHLNMCGASMVVAVAATFKDAATVALPAAVTPVCPTDHDQTCSLGIYKYMAKVACIAGRCRVGSRCQPDVFGVGTVCDDEKYCTVNDVCIGPDTCAGTPRDCSDGDASTVDTCTPAFGCLHSSP